MQNDPSPALALRRMIEGYQVSQALHVAATLGIADLLAEGERSADELAASTGTHAPTLYRLLRALASVEVLHEGDAQRFTLAPMGQTLRSDAEGSMAGWAAFIGSSAYWQAWSGLLYGVRTGENAFVHAHGQGVWDYRAAHPENGALFDRAMTALSKRASAAMLAACDFSGLRSIVDVGGGNGALLAAVLLAHPELQGTLMDLPEVVARAQAQLVVAGMGDRCRVVGGSFFEQVPAGADAYLLRSVIHDWDDGDAVRILATVAKAMATHSRVLVVERVIAPPNEGRDAKFSDLNMLVAPGGRERTLAEFEAVLEPAGLKLGRVVDAGGFSVLEAVAAA
ncbi:Multifunctional cyclase-dehydratase-3-O-methyl transferase TcmN [Variovorax sp. PBL-H6]|uniref:methyltransferase n=1 Tax=Variovorax sp. PBL-H6 TaxID=434009 RepID=UPI00131812C7|nr:methyltransferase [Variovorax sp. PBL-H6]VTU39679.1 Multifunctional cyclase-dehydratase-3-O-methyl transferase TcmN [Variovorax sp. PBL-H6]